MLRGRSNKGSSTYERNQPLHIRGAEEQQSPCRIHIFGWYKNPRVALISSQMRIFWNSPSSHKLVSDASTFATTLSSTSAKFQLLLLTCVH